jgi:Protein of unknown function (DUF3300)
MDTQARSNATRATSWLAPRFWLAFGVLAIGAAVATLRPAAAQEAPAVGLASAEELHEIVGPIALYPDDLVAIVLPASTYPLQIVQAARFLEDRERDSSLEPNEEWDDSVVALLNYPEVVKLLNDDLDWTYDLGTAVLNQRADVLDAIQGFRDEAYAAGNLRSDERQTVAVADDTIEITPADPEVIYVPYYEPERVVVYQPAPVYYYYPRPYPVYYYPYPAYHNFYTGFFWGVSTWFSIGWHSHHVHVYDPFYYGHPYYGWSYYNPFYVRNVYVNVNHYPNYVWEPTYRHGGRPVVRGSEGRVYPADRAPRHGVLDSNAAAARTTEGSAYRTTEGTATTARTSNGTHEPRRGVTSSSYRNRNAASSQPEATGAAQAGGSTRGAERSAQAQGQARGQVHARQPSAAAASARTATSPGTNRSGGGMSQAARGQSQARQPSPATESGARTPTSPSTYRSGGGMSQAARGQAQARQPSPAAESARTPTSQGNRSSGGGMSQALGRSRATAPNTEARTSPGVSPRAVQGSTGMPRESSRAAAPARQSSFDPPSHGGGASAQRSESGGSRSNGGSHGNAGGGGNDGGSSYRGGGSERGAHAASRTR